MRTVGIEWFGSHSVTAADARSIQVSVGGGKCWLPGVWPSFFFFPLPFGAQWALLDSYFIFEVKHTGKSTIFFFSHRNGRAWRTLMSACRQAAARKMSSCFWTQKSWHQLMLLRLDHWNVRSISLLQQLEIIPGPLRKTYIKWNPRCPLQEFYIRWKRRNWWLNSFIAWM